MIRMSDYMNLALKLAEYGRYTVSPNPMVGCVIVKDDVIVGKGYHQQAGGPHAEIAALQQAGDLARGATAYVTLEPCCHYGKTPPCTQALIKAGIKKVITACKDPNPLVAGKGLEELIAAGIEVESGVCEAEATTLNEIFFHFIRTQQPFVIAKWAMSLDGKTVTHKEDDRNISCQQSRAYAHQIRQQVDAILIGSATALHDDPQLTARHTAELIKQPLRIVLSSRGNLPLDLKLFDASAKTLVVTTTHAQPQWISQLQEKNIEVLVLPEQTPSRIDLHSLVKKLGEKNISSLLVEGGMTILQEFFNENLVNKIHVYLAPNIIGSMKKKSSVKNITLSNIEQDFFITANYEGNNHV